MREPVKAGCGHNPAKKYKKEETRGEWIEKQAPSWLEHGQAYKRIREQRGFSMRKVAKDICISPARLKKFENGLPVYDSN